MSPGPADACPDIGHWSNKHHVVVPGAMGSEWSDAKLLLALAAAMRLPSCRADSSAENSAANLARPATPKCARISGSFANRINASANAPGSPAGTRKPVLPSSTISGTPAIRVETTGFPAAIASRITVGSTSHAPFSSTRHASANTSQSASSARILSCGSRPAPNLAVGSGQSFDLACQRFSKRSLARDFAPKRHPARLQTRARGDQVRETFELDQPPDAENPQRAARSGRPGPAPASGPAAGRCKPGEIFASASGQRSISARRLQSLTATTNAACSHISPSSASLPRSTRKSCACAVKRKRKPVNAWMNSAACVARFAKWTCRCSTPRRRSRSAKYTACRARRPVRSARRNRVSWSGNRRAGQRPVTPCRRFPSTRAVTRRCVEHRRRGAVLRPRAGTSSSAGCTSRFPPRSPPPPSARISVSQNVCEGTG